MCNQACCSIRLAPVSKVLKTISEDTRLKILCMLKGGEQCVCEIQEALRLPHTLVLHHLNKLKSIGLIQLRKENKYTFYRLELDAYGQFLRDLNLLLGVR